MIELREVTKQYKGGINALQSVNLQIRQGEFVSIIGPSGAGKTTLLRLLNGMLTPTSGDIYIEGEQLNRSRRKKKQHIQQKISTIYQNFCLVGNSTVLDNVLNAEIAHMSFLKVLFGIFTKEQKKRAQMALSDVGLKEKCLVKAKELSGGQQQRVAIARALMQNSVIVLADEPVSALDPVTSKQILSLLKKLQKERGLTIVMNSHNVAFAKEYSDRLIGIKDGKVVFDDKADHLSKEALQKIYGTDVLERVDGI